MGIMIFNKEEMISNCQHALSICKKAMIINYNCEYQGHLFDIVAQNDGTTVSFEARCRQAIEQAFLAGAWSDIVIATKLDRKQTNYAARIVGQHMCDHFRENGEDANVSFDGREFEMNYVLKGEAA